MNVVFLFGVSFISARMLVGAIAAIFLLSKGISIYELGILKTFQASVIFFLDIPLGYISDKYGHKKTIILSVVFAAGWLIITGLCTTLSALILAEMLNGISLALFGGAFDAYLIRYYKSMGATKESRTILADFQKYQFLFMALSSMLGASFVAPDSVLPWLIAAACCGAIALLGILYLPDLRDIKPNQRTGGMIDLIFQDIKDGYTQLSSKSIVNIIVSFMPLAIYYQIIIQFWQPFIQNITNLKIEERGFFWAILFALILIAQSLSSWVAGKVGDTFSLLKISVAITVLTMVLLSAPLFSQSNFDILALIAIVFMFFQLRLSSLAAAGLFHDRISDDLRATLDSFVSSMLRLFLLILFPLVGFLIDKFGWSTIFGMYGFLLCSQLFFVKSLSIRI